MSNTRTPAMLCWHCDRMLDAITPAQGDPKPKPGYPTLCLYCGAVGILGPLLEMLPPTKEKLDELEDDRDFMRTFAQFSWARQYVMLNQSLMRDRDDPDR